MKLISLEIVGRGDNGLSFPRHEFGDVITQLSGPNGSGKTPTLQALMFCLGYHTQFRRDIYERCKVARLTIEIDGNQCVIAREFESHKSFCISMGGGEDKSFHNEKDFSLWFFEKVGIYPSKLVSTKNLPEDPYMSTVLPLFYLDQDEGYKGIYMPKSSFIKDQFAEAIRLVNGFPPRNSFDQKKGAINLKHEIALLDKRVVEFSALIERKISELGDKRESLDFLNKKIHDCQREMESLRVSKDIKSDAEITLDGIILDSKKRYQSLIVEMSDLGDRVSSVEKIKSEIETEINTLSLNEESRRIFSSFSDICARPDCGMFLGSTESFGNNLLYLRDQIKDLDRHTVSHRMRLEVLSGQKLEAERVIDELVRKRVELGGKSATSGYMEAVSELSQRLFELQVSKKAVEDLDASERIYVDILNKRNSLQDELAGLDTTGRSENLSVLQFRTALKAKIAAWLDVLNTVNVSRDITIQPDFTPVFGDEGVGPIKGSTKTRAVLAAHAALFELYLEDGKHHLRFLILDTPKQHEIQTEDLELFIEKMEILARRKGAQIILSNTEYQHDCHDGDEIWTPKFPGERHPMYYGLRSLSDSKLV